MRRELRTEIEIAAPAGRVWQVLIDFAAYPRWNPFIREAEGVLAVGARLRVRIQPPGGRTMTFRPRVLAVVPGRELRWLGRVGMPGLFDGEHVFTIESVGAGRVRLVHREIFTGLLVPVLVGWLEAGTRRGFEAMNAALRARAEADG